MEKSVYSHIVCRIGNNLFQIAAGYTLALENDCEFYAVLDREYNCPFPDNCNFKTYIDKFTSNILRNVEFKDINWKELNIYNEPDFGYSKIQFKNNICLHGWFQTEKYFNQFEKEIRNLFSIDSETESIINNNYNNIFNNSFEKISINIRRGDYMNSLNNFNVCSKEYIDKCINYFGDNKIFVITSDDINWCKQNFPQDNVFIIDQDKSIIDLWIQAKCDHNIMSCSTFSWWGSWLNSNQDKKVIIPQPWFGPSQRHLKSIDIPSKDWLLMDLI